MDCTEKTSSAIEVDASSTQKGSSKGSIGGEKALIGVSFWTVIRKRTGREDTSRSPLGTVDTMWNILADLAYSTFSVSLTPTSRVEARSCSP